MKLRGTAQRPRRNESLEPELSEVHTSRESITYTFRERGQKEFVKKEENIRNVQKFLIPNNGLCEE